MRSLCRGDIACLLPREVTAQGPTVQVAEQVVRPMFQRAPEHSERLRQTKPWSSLMCVKYESNVYGADIETGGDCVSVGHLLLLVGNTVTQCGLGQKVWGPGTKRGGGSSSQ